MNTENVEPGTSDAICHPPAPASSQTLKKAGSSALQASLVHLSAQMGYMQQREKADEWSHYNYNSPQEMRVACPMLAPGSSFGPARV